MEKYWQSLNFIFESLQDHCIKCHTYVGELSLLTNDFCREDKLFSKRREVWLHLRIFFISFTPCLSKHYTVVRGWEGIGHRVNIWAIVNIRARKRSWTVSGSHALCIWTGTPLGEWRTTWFQTIMKTIHSTLLYRQYSLGQSKTWGLKRLWTVRSGF